MFGVFVRDMVYSGTHHIALDIIIAGISADRFQVLRRDHLQPYLF